MKTFFLVLILLTQISCVPNQGDNTLKIGSELVSDQEINDTNVENEVVTFDIVFKEIFEPKCLACHSNWINDEEKVKQRLVAGSTIDSPLFLKVESGQMPPSSPPLSVEELDIIRGYIEGLEMD